jgi:N-acetylmuramate 1-kinase
MAQRLALLRQWLDSELGMAGFDIEPASADASFRRYFRVTFNGENRIVMDAPPDKEDIRPFVRIGRQLRAIGLNVPEILAENLDQGFLLLSDLGSRQYLNQLNEQNVDILYGDAMSALAILQARGPGVDELPPYDRKLLWQEMALFRDWLLHKHLGIDLDAPTLKLLNETFALLADNALAQPTVSVHRDYHSRNLMVCEQNPGILDFQDAVYGPLTYDLASLLRDCYIAWPRERVEGWVLQYHDIAVQNGILNGAQEERFLRWFDLMGVQRHLKASGIFARLNHRDGKPGYLEDIPRTLEYVVEVSARYAELHPFQRLLESLVLPALLESSEDKRRKVKG